MNTFENIIMRTEQLMNHSIEPTHKHKYTNKNSMIKQNNP
jgi:hypothetical protein